MHWPFEKRQREQVCGPEVSASHHLPGLPAIDRFQRCNVMQAKENFKSVAESGTKSAALSGYSLMVEQ
jgi:hypothetical protein